MKAQNLRSLTILTVLFLFLWTDRAHAHSLPLFLLPVIGSFLFLPLAFFTALVGWLAKGLYYLNRTEKESLSKIGWSDALKEAGLMYLCFIVAAFFLDLGIAFVTSSSHASELLVFAVVLAVTTVLSSLATMFLHRRFLERMSAEENRESLQSAKAWHVVSLGLISPAIFSSIMYLWIGSRL